jgi:thioredoxin reductase
MKAELDVAIIGAGPYGLSIAAYLSGAGIDNKVFGATMDTWEHHMPPGMQLKSYGDSSNLFDPQSSFTIEHFCRERGIAYHSSNVPVSLETFVAYGKSFQEQFVPGVERKRLVSLKPAHQGHELVFDDAERLLARRVILAIGVLPYKYTPADLLGNLPPELLSHSADHGPLAHLAKKTVTVLGKGASALDIAALLAMQGSAVTLLTRGSALKFQSAPPVRKSPLRAAARQLLRPQARGLGSGWVLAACAAAPQLIHVLPDKIRVAILNNYLGPSGGYFIRERIEQLVTVKLGTTVERAEENRGRVRLVTINCNGTRETIESDHLVAATGYRADLRRLDFLGDHTLKRVRMIDHVPVLSRDYESSIAGLHFVGLTSARGFGPIMRFVEGALHPAVHLARLFGRSRQQEITHYQTSYVADA